MSDTIQVHWDDKKSCFEIYTPFHLNGMAKALPDHRWAKGKRCWEAPLLKKNALFMRQHYTAAEFSPEARKALDSYQLPSSNKSSKFPPWYQFKTEPMDHQHEFLNNAWGNSEHAALLSMGGGKTKCVIDWFTALRMDNQADAVLIICDSSIKFVWEDELAIHCPIPYQTFVMEAGKNKKALNWMEDDHDFPWFIVGVEALSQGKAIEIAQHFAKIRRVAMAIDEATSIKNSSSIRTERCVDLGIESKFRCPMTGTPVTNGYEDLYSVFNYMNPEIIGISSYYSFRNQYCVMGGFEDRQIVAYNNIDELIETIDPYCTRKTKEQMMDLPPKVFEPRLVNLTKQQQTMYDSMKDDMMIAIGDDDELTADMVLEQMLRLQQIVGGFYATETEEGSYEVHPIEGKNPKVDELKRVISEIKGEKMIVWCRYKPELRLVVEELKKARVRTVEFHGDMSTDEKRASVRAIQEGEGQVIVATMAMAKGQTLTKATYSCIFSNSFSLEMRQQLEDRNHRKGTEQQFEKDEDGNWTGKITYIDILAKETLDTKQILPALIKKKTRADYFDEKIDPSTVSIRGASFKDMI